MRVPIYIINYEETAVPIPGGKSWFTLHSDKRQFFNTKKLPGDDSEYVVIGVTDYSEFSHIGTISTDWHSDEGLTPIWKIGTLCRVLKREPIDKGEVVVLDAVSRVYLRSFYEESTPDKHAFRVEVELEKILEGYEYGEEDLELDILDMLDVIQSNASLWITAPQRTIDLINSNKHSLQKMHLIADWLFVGKDRLRYIQESNNAVRWDMVLEKIVSVVKEHVKSKEAKKLKKNIKVKNDGLQILLKNKEEESSEKQNWSKVEEPPPVKKELSWPRKLRSSKMPEETKDKISREVKKLSKTPKASTEYAQTEDYLRWVFDLPWGKNEVADLNLRALSRRFNETHYGLEDVKEHLLEIMCVQELQSEPSGTVLCFLGPAGTGKTTIAKTIAEVTNRPLIRIALGGLSDTADLRGHRRTYIASRPGRIVTELINKKTFAPLILLDEIDKLGHFRGDPSAVLLEALDPEQNDHFTDHYLEVPIDISKAMFICTANYEDKIPGPLLDRMELIRFRSYDDEERSIITKKFILPKTQSQMNPTNLPVRFEESALDRISGITQVRQIEKILAKLIRKGVTRIYLYGESEYVITEKDVQEIEHNYDTNKTKSSIGF